VETNPFPPQQQRSRQTLERLLKACVRTLDRDGLEGCTLPRIAVEAGVSPATVYRRFADKDALLCAAFLDILQRSNDANRENVPKSILRPTLEETAERLVDSLIRQYRTHPRLLRALSLFVDTHAGSDFSNEARQLIANNLQLVSAVLLKHRKSIRHPNPQRAVSFAVLNVTSSIETIVFDGNSLWQVTLPLDDAKLSAELTRSLIAYLRYDP